MRAPVGVLWALAGAGLVSARARAVEVDVPAAAEHAPAELARAVRVLWADSPEVRAARAELEAAAARARASARPLYNPELQLGAENADVDRRTLGLSLGLDVSGKRDAHRAVGDAGETAARAAYVQVRRDVAARWLKAWFAAQLSGRETALGRRRVELMQRFATLAEQRLKVGDISLSERDLATLALTEAQAQQAALLGRAAGLQAALTALGGPGGPAGLAEVAGSGGPAELAEVAGPAELAGFAAPPTLRGWPEVAADGAWTPDDLPELRQARAVAEGAQAGVRLAARQRLPDPVLTLTGGRVRTAPGLSQNVIGLNLTVPLPIRNNYRAELDAARASSEAALAGVDAQRLSLRARQRESAARYAALREACIAFAGSRAAAFDERAALLERLWRAGEIGTSDYLVQLRQSLDTALSGTTLENETWQAWIDHLGASGRLNAWLGAGDEENAR
jgi:cobalt-zinc-cadmium efflux system outer membrane protein